MSASQPHSRHSSDAKRYVQVTTRDPNVPDSLVALDDTYLPEIR